DARSPSFALRVGAFDDAVGIHDDLVAGLKGKRVFLEGRIRDHAERVAAAVQADVTLFATFAVDTIVAVFQRDQGRDVVAGVGKAHFAGPRINHGGKACHRGGAASGVPQDAVDDFQ